MIKKRLLSNSQELSIEFEMMNFEYTDAWSFGGIGITNNQFT